MNEKRNIPLLHHRNERTNTMMIFRVFIKNSRRSWGSAHAVFGKRLGLGRRVSIGDRGRMRQLSFRYQAADSGSIVLCPSLLGREVSNLDAFSTLTPKRSVLPFKIEKGRLLILSSGCVYLYMCNWPAWHQWADGGPL